MKDKGVSGIIATILLVMIAIALVGTAYMYFTGIVTGKTAKTISVEASCNGTAVTLVISNDGTRDIASGDLTILIDNSDYSADFIATGGGYPIEPNTNQVVVDATTGHYTSATDYNALVVSPSNSARQIVSC